MVILRVSVEVGQDDKDDSNNPIFSMMTTMKKRLWRIARHPPQPAWIFFAFLNLIHGGKLKKRRERTNRIAIHVQHYTQQFTKQFVSCRKDFANQTQD